jgi:hypothetical protein
VDSTNALIPNYLQKGMGASGAWTNPYGKVYEIKVDLTNTTTNFYVISPLPSTTSGIADASVIAGQLPSGITATNITSLPVPPAQCALSSSSDCYVVSSVGPPGSNLANARSVNFANLYKSGQCVPVPTCPAGMTAEILASPAGVSGINDGGESPNVYPLSSYTAYAKQSALNPIDCDGSSSSANANCASTNVEGGYSSMYWRVCLSVTTEKGVVSQTKNLDAQNIGTIMVITRCQPGNPPNEKTGSPNFNVYN